VRRHLPFVLFLLALISLVTALARPAAIVSAAGERATIILAIDVSQSMCSTDVLPSRLVAAKASALSFVREQPARTQIGIVAFAGYAQLVRAPTTNRRELARAISDLSAGRATAIGSAITASLDAIASAEEPGPTPDPEPPPVAENDYAPSIVVLLTDGANNAGLAPLDAAQEAADRGIRLYTIGYGTAQGGGFYCGGLIQRGLRPGGGFRESIDEETLRKVSATTGGAYYLAESADELNEVFHSLPTRRITEQDTAEISVAFVALGALMIALAGVLSLSWHPLP
jgi:Ca-activated chloride channel family protein